ncbi:MAG: hypothetical protein GY838_05755, partial [bacterium]|nr:hypothetical protein [bacterium]
SVESMIKTIQEGVEDTGLHIATRDFAYGQIKDGVKPGAVKGILRGLMSGYNLNDSRQKENFSTIDRTVDKAVIKIETEKSQNLKTKSLENILDESKKETKNVIPKELLKPGGILQDIMDMYYCNSIFYYPDLALITALSLWGGVMSNRIMSETYLRTHLYCFVTAGTGVGKNAIFTTINGFLNQSGDELKYNSLRDLCGSNEITSASALVAELEPEVFEENKNAQQQDTSQKLMILDEIGFIFERMKQTGNQEAIGTLNKLYTINCAKETSKHKKRHAKATKHNNIELFNPCLSIIGLSTKNKFWQGIDLENIDSGFFPRILLINIPKRSTRKMVEPYDIEKLTKKIFVLMKKYPKAKSPPIFKLTDMLRNRLHEWEDKLLNKHEQDTIDYSIYTRAEEFVYKLSLLHSSSLGLNYIDENSLDWSMKLTECILTYKIKESKLYIHESKLSEVSDKIIFKMKRYMINKKESKVTKEHMSKYIRRGFESRDYSDALAFLIDSEIIIRTEEQTSKKKTIFFQLTT